MKKTFLIALSAMVMMSCSNSNNNKQQEVAEEVKQLEIAEVVEVVKYELPEDKYANKTIKVKGMQGQTMISIISRLLFIRMVM